MAFNNKSKKSNNAPCNFTLCITLFFIVILTIPAIFLHISTTNSTCTTLKNSWSGELPLADFAWNKLSFTEHNPSPILLKIAVFSRKWPMGTTPGGMERHAHTLHTALARRGHQVHVFTSPPEDETTSVSSYHQAGAPSSPYIHCHEGEPGKWRYNKAWEQFLEENQREPFDVVHSESVALPHWLARKLPNLAVSWHGIALESLQSRIFQDLARRPDEPRSQITKKSNCLLTLTPSPSCKTSSRIEDQNFIDTFHQTPCIQSFHPCLVHCESTSLIYRIRRKMPTEHDPDPFINCHPCVYE